MPVELSEIVKEYGGILGKGLTIKMAPRIVKGALVGVLTVRKTDVAKATEWVQKDVVLWDTIEPESQRALNQIAHWVGNLDWVDVAWCIKAIKDDFPAVASLFLGWKKGNNWLARQVAIIKERALGELP